MVRNMSVKEYMKKWRKENKEKDKKLRDNYKKKAKKLGKYCKGNNLAQKNRYNAKNRDKCRAWSKLHYAIAHGKIKKADRCSICNSLGIIMAHHHDYNKPLDIIWVCWKCHNKIHGEMR